jgi:hypothetical protein
VSRALQRGLGEAILQKGGAPISFQKFVVRYQAGGALRAWIDPLADLLDETKSKSKRTRSRARQLVLQYGVVMHALVDTLDEEHHVGRDRPGIPNKLADRTKRDLRNRVFKLYLGVVPNPDKYVGNKKSHRPAESEDSLGLG